MKKGFKISFWIKFLVILVVGYVAVQFFLITNSNIETEVISEGMLTDGIVCNGIFAREETVINYAGNGFIGYTVEDGQRVSTGDIVANVFSSYEQMVQSLNAQLIQREITALESSQISSDGTDVNMIINQVYVNLNSFLTTLEQNNLQNLSEDKLDLQLSANKAQIVTEQATDYTQRLTELMQQVSAISQTPMAVVAAPTAGYFVAAHSSSVSAFSKQQLEQMSPDDLLIATQTPILQNSAEVAGKIIHDYKWSMFISVTAQEAEKFVLGRQVDIAFPKTENEPLPAYVETIAINEETGTAKIELSCNYINSDVVKMQQAEVEIQFRNYEGLLINKEALRVLDGVEGVFIQTGNTIDFCKINIVFADEHYVLVANEYVSDENEVRMFDTVILSGREIYDGRVI